MYAVQTYSFCAGAVILMNRNLFQPRLSMAKFFDQYGSVSLCKMALDQTNWPVGFRCPWCGTSAHCVLRRCEPQNVPVQRVPSSTRADCGHGLPWHPWHEASTGGLVSCHLPHQSNSDLGAGAGARTTTRGGVTRPRVLFTSSVMHAVASARCRTHLPIQPSIRSQNAASVVARRRWLLRSIREHDFTVGSLAKQDAV
mgnify:CR=1 FL=1